MRLGLGLALRQAFPPLERAHELRYLTPDDLEQLFQWVGLNDLERARYRRKLRELAGASGVAA